MSLLGVHKKKIFSKQYTKKKGILIETYALPDPCPDRFKLFILKALRTYPLPSNMEFGHVLDRSTRVL